MDLIRSVEIENFKTFSERIHIDIQHPAVLIGPNNDRTARHEWLDLYHFDSIGQVQNLATKWLWTYNNERPSSAVGGVPPRMIKAPAA